MATFVLLGVLVVFASAAILRWLWNMTIPQVFGLKEIEYWQAFRLLLIAGILFGAFHYQAPVAGAGFQIP